MSDREETLGLVEAGLFDRVEDRWLAKLSEPEPDTEFFLSVLRLLLEADEEDRSRFLFEMLEEHMREAQHWGALLGVLEGIGLSFYEPAELHAEIVATVRAAYPESQILDALIDKVGLLRAIEDTPKIWRKVKRLRGLMLYDHGAVVWMEGKGAGRVTEVNLELESFKLDLDQHPGLRVGFAAAPKVLKPLPEGHFLRRKVEEPEAVAELAKANPGQVLLELLRSADEPMAASEIKQLIGNLVPSAKWTTWWAEARKNPQVLSTGPSARQRYSWASSSDHAHDAILQSFEDADLDQRLMIYRKEAARSKELSEIMTAELKQHAEACRGTDPATALTIWGTLEHRSASDSESSQLRAIITEIDDFSSVVAVTQDRSLRERCYELAVEARQSWPDDLGRSVTLEPDGRLLSALANRLRSGHPEILESALETICGQPRKHPAGFVWLVENADSDLIDRRNALRLLRQIFDAFHQPEFKGYRNRLEKVLEGTAAGSMIRNLEEDQAVQARQAISRAPIEEHFREVLTQAVEFQFPSIVKEREDQLYATDESIALRRAEMKNLIEVEIPANRKAIEEARELGDLRENFEYKSARQRHEYLNARVEALQRDLERVRPFDPTSIPADEVRIGSTCVLQNSAGQRMDLKIMGPWESDPDAGVISYASDLGRKLLGHRVGDTVDVEGDTYEVASIGGS